MPVPVSAGTILYRRRAAGEGGDASLDDDEAWEVLLVHPSGAYNRKAPWSIPKGLPDAGEALEDAARRETREETGVEAGGLVEIGRVRYRKSRKDIVAFAGPAPDGCDPRCASWEVDRAEFVSLRRARELIHPDQAVFIGTLEKGLGVGDWGSGSAGAAPAAGRPGERGRSGDDPDDR
jgi:predicted NUDIX family NTP pyrophosphohydrolase